MSPKFQVITHNLSLSGGTPSAEPYVRSTTHLFLSKTNHERLLWSQHYLHNPPANIHHPHHEWIPVEASINKEVLRSGCFPRRHSAQMVCSRDPPLPNCLTCLSTCLAPSRSGTLAAVTQTRNTNPRVSTVIKRLRPMIMFAHIVAYRLHHTGCTLHTLTIKDGVSVGPR